MDKDLIHHENISPDLLAEVFDAACLEYKQDEGALVVDEEINVRVFIDAEAKVLTLSSSFGFKDGVEEIQKLRLGNYINQMFVLVSCHVHEDALAFQLHLPLNSGFTRKYLINTLRRFAAVPRSAVQDAMENLELDIVD